MSFHSLGLFPARKPLDAVTRAYNERAAEYNARQVVDERARRGCRRLLFLKTAHDTLRLAAANVGDGHADTAAWLAAVRKTVITRTPEVYDAFRLPSGARRTCTCCGGAVV